MEEENRGGEGEEELGQSASVSCNIPHHTDTTTSAVSTTTTSTTYPSTALLSLHHRCTVHLTSPHLHHVHASPVSTFSCHAGRFYVQCSWRRSVSMASDLPVHFISPYLISFPLTYFIFIASSARLLYLPSVASRLVYGKWVYLSVIRTSLPAPYYLYCLLPCFAFIF